MDTGDKPELYKIRSMISGYSSFNPNFCISKHKNANPMAAQLSEYAVKFGKS